MRRSTGRLIAVEGIDQSGKRTQSLLLAKALTANKQPNALFSFPDYSTPLGQQLRAYLSGKIHPDYHVVHMLYAANKWERAREILDQINNGRFVIVNRYTPSNLAYGHAHGLNLQWLYHLESNLPRPNIVFVLDVSPKSSFARKRKSRDIHEGDLAYLSRVRKIYRRLATRYGWKFVNAEQEEAIVHSILWKEISPLLKHK